MNLRVLHETLMVGQGYFDPQVQAGVHRAIVAVMGKLTRMPEIAQDCRAFITSESALGRKPTLLPGTRIPTWCWRRGTQRGARWILPHWIRSFKERPHWHPARVAFAAAYRALSTSVRKPTPLSNWDAMRSWYHPLPAVGFVPGTARILTVHDVIPLIDPAWFPPGSEAYASGILDSLTPADFVVCSLQAKLVEMLRLRDYPVARTMAINLAADTPLYSRIRRRHRIALSRQPAFTMTAEVAASEVVYRLTAAQHQRSSL